MYKTIVVFLFSSLLFVSCSETIDESDQAYINMMTEDGEVTVEGAECIVKDMKKNMSPELYTDFMTMMVDEGEAEGDMEAMMAMLMQGMGFLTMAADKCGVELDM